MGLEGRPELNSQVCLLWVYLLWICSVVLWLCLPWPYSPWLYSPWQRGVASSFDEVKGRYAVRLDGGGKEAPPLPLL